MRPDKKLSNVLFRFQTGDDVLAFGRHKDFQNWYHGTVVEVEGKKVKVCFGEETGGGLHYEWMVKADWPHHKIMNRTLHIPNLNDFKGKFVLSDHENDCGRGVWRFAKSWKSDKQPFNENSIMRHLNVFQKEVLNKHMDNAHAVAREIHPFLFNDTEALLTSPEDEPMDTSDEEQLEASWTSIAFKSASHSIRPVSARGFSGPSRSSSRRQPSTDRSLARRRKCRPPGQPQARAGIATDSAGGGGGGGGGGGTEQNGGLATGADLVPLPLRQFRPGDECLVHYSCDAPNDWWQATVVRVVLAAAGGGRGEDVVEVSCGELMSIPRCDWGRRILNRSFHLHSPAHPEGWELRFTLDDHPLLPGKPPTGVWAYRRPAAAARGGGDGEDPRSSGGAAGDWQEGHLPYLEAAQDQRQQLEEAVEMLAATARDQYAPLLLCWPGEPAAYKRPRRPRSPSPLADGPYIEFPPEPSIPLVAVVVEVIVTCGLHCSGVAFSCSIVRRGLIRQPFDLTDTDVRSDADVEVELVYGPVPDHSMPLLRKFDPRTELGIDRWSVGLIMGPSGSGKSCTLRCIDGGQPVVDLTRGDDDWDPSKSVVSQVHEQSTLAIWRLISLGMGSPRDMLKRFGQLSRGLQHRVCLARGLRSDARLDELGSGLEADTARLRSVAAGLGSAVRKEGLENVVAASCHGSILIPWLRPDWVYKTDNSTTWRLVGPADPARPCRYVCTNIAHPDEHIFPVLKPVVEWDHPPGVLALAPWSQVCGGQHSVPPPPGLGLTTAGIWAAERLHVRLRRCERRRWREFRAMHYRDYLNPSAKCFLASLVVPAAPSDASSLGCLSGGDDEPAGSELVVGFVAVLPQPGRYNARATRQHRGLWREHRVCTAEAWQGVGIGTAISDAVAQRLVDEGYRFSSTFRHPRLLHHRKHHKDLWKARKVQAHRISKPFPRQTRAPHPGSFSFRFIGPPVATAGRDSDCDASSEKGSGSKGAPLVVRAERGSGGGCGRAGTRAGAAAGGDSTAPVSRGEDGLARVRQFGGVRADRLRGERVVGDRSVNARAGQDTWGEQSLSPFEMSLSEEEERSADDSEWESWTSEEEAGAVSSYCDLVSSSGDSHEISSSSGSDWEEYVEEGAGKDAEDWKTEVVAALDRLMRRSMLF